MDKKKILVVDDEVSLTRLLKLNLEKTGRFEVREENQGASVIKVVKEFRPDMIFLDVMMPDMDGSTVADTIRSTPGMDSIPIVFLTAVVSREEADAQKGVIGGQPFLAKPANIETVLACIDQQLGAE